LERPRANRQKVQCECQKIERSPTVWAEWIELKKYFAKFQAERGKETSDDKGSDDMTSKDERKRKSNASPVEFFCRSLTGGNVWDSLADLLKLMQLRGAGADDVTEVQEIVQRFFTNIVKPARSKRDIANRQRRMSTTCCLSSLTTCIQFGLRTPFWIKPKNWRRMQSMSIQLTI